MQMKRAYFKTQYIAILFAANIPQPPLPSLRCMRPQRLKVKMQLCLAPDGTHLGYIVKWEPEQ
jgi:hypothetical protein